MATSPILFVFPGQGSQYPGIGKDLFDAFESVRKLYGQASEVLGYDLAQLSFEDPEGKINLTRYTQPVLLTHSISCLQAFQEVTNGKVGAGLGPATVWESIPHWLQLALWIFLVLFNW